MRLKINTFLHLGLEKCRNSRTLPLGGVVKCRDMVRGVPMVDSRVMWSETQVFDHMTLFYEIRFQVSHAIRIQTSRIPP